MGQHRLLQVGHGPCTSDATVASILPTTATSATVLLLQAQTRLAEVQLEVLRLQHRIMRPQVCRQSYPDVVMKYLILLSKEYRDFAPLSTTCAGIKAFSGGLYNKDFLGRSFTEGFFKDHGVPKDFSSSFGSKDNLAEF